MNTALGRDTDITVYGRGQFSRERVRDWETDRCIAFAVALERLRGWPIHATFIGDEMVRLQAENGGNRVFDPRGILSIVQFKHAVILRQAQYRAHWPSTAFDRDGSLQPRTECVGEEGLAAIGVSVDEHPVREAMTQIAANTAYLDLVPERPYPRYPASTLERYAWQYGVEFTEALARITGLPPVHMHPYEILEDDHADRDRIHAMILHPDGTVEDVWGRRSQDVVAQDKAILSWTLSEDAHRNTMAVVHRFSTNVADRIAEAEAAIRRYRVDASTVA